MARLTLEVIATSVEDAVEAARGGAHRLEVVRDLSVGGLTPSIDLVRQIQQAVSVHLRVMVRESSGFTCGSSDQLRTLANQVMTLETLGVDGIVVGWTRNGGIDEGALAQVLEAGPSLRATFHRAFDSLEDPEGAPAALRRHRQIDRVLTGGGTGTWTSRCAELRRYARWAGEGMVILPGGGIDAAALGALARCDGITEAHVGRAARVGCRIEGRVSAEAVRALRLAAGWDAVDSPNRTQ